MNIVQITPGAGGMYCGNCFRDNELVKTLRQLGHPTLMVPLYLPMTLDEPNQSAGTPIFFSGINVYLEQKSAFFRKAPQWLHRWLASPKLLKWAAGRAARTRAAEVADLTISMLRGEEGHQARELRELIDWLKAHGRPDVVCLSNALLAGMARQIKTELDAPVICTLQGEDEFLDALPDGAREQAWQLLAKRAEDMDLFIAPSRYFGERMGRRLAVPADRLQIVPNGIDPEGYQPAAAPPDPPVLGFFARMCREKGLDILVEAYLILRRNPRFKQLQLHIGGGCGPSDEPFVATLREQLARQGALAEVSFFPNVDHAGKLAFYRSLSVFSVPARYSEAFGLYVIEALAAGVPVVQPRHAAFPELIEATGGGILCEPEQPAALAAGLESLLLDPATARVMGRKGRESVNQVYHVRTMAERLVALYSAARGGSAIAAASLAASAVGS